MIELEKINRIQEAEENNSPDIHPSLVIGLLATDIAGTGAILVMLEQKVLKYIQEHKLVEAGDRVLVGVSGGPDSLCLLHLLNRLAPRLKISLAVGHLNHGIRPEAAGEAEMVRNLAASWSLPFVMKKLNVPRFARVSGLSEEEAGRILRYRFLEEAARRYRANKVAVAHHRDD